METTWALANDKAAEVLDFLGNLLESNASENRPEWRASRRVGSRPCGDQLVQPVAIGAVPNLVTAPSLNEEYLIYQTLLGTWPFSAEEVNEGNVKRIQRYMLKAIKEAKVNSSWIQPNEDWEAAVKKFIAGATSLAS